MSLKKVRQINGLMFITGAILVNIPFTLLMMNFDYPDILRYSAGEILARFAAGGSSLIWTWLVFAWVGLPILVGILLLPKSMQDETSTGQLALFFGASGALVQIIGLLRWSFVVPILARIYNDPQSSYAAKEAVSIVFQAVHQYGGVVLGEHLGQSFTILWMFLVSLSMMRLRRFPLWLPISGFFIAGIYALAQGDLFATVIPGFPVWEASGLIGSLLWLAWLIALGVLLLRTSREIA